MECGDTFLMPAPGGTDPFHRLANVCLARMDVALCRVHVGLASQDVERERIQGLHAASSNGSTIGCLSLEGKQMRLLHVSVLACIFTTGVLAADNQFLGTWKLNTAKSKYSPGPGPKNLTITYAQDGDQIKRTVEGVNAEGEPISMQASIKWDGQDHAIPNPSGPPMTVAATMVDDRTVNYTVKTDGKVTTTGRAVLSKDGKTVTNTETGVNPKGEKVHNVVVGERQ